MRRFLFLLSVWLAIPFTVIARDMGYINEVLHDSIIVYDIASGTFVTGLNDGDFTKRISKDGTADATTVIVTEINPSTRPGEYDVSFTPTSAGSYSLLVINATYFPAGKLAVYDVQSNSLDDIRTRGDVAWITATGFSTHSAADVWAVPTRAITDKNGFSLAANQSSVTIGTVTTITNDVGITQAGADKTWSTASRALTDKSGFSLAADQSAVTVGTVNALGTIAKSDVRTQVDGALTAIELDHLIHTSFGAAKATVGSLLDLIMHKDESQTFARDTDSLEALGEAGVGGVPSAGVIADAVWDEVTSGHVTSSTFGKDIQNIKDGSAGDFAPTTDSLHDIRRRVDQISP